jgi:DNA helicase-2/ATP-dependent DNA helicase PcrA
MALQRVINTPARGIGKTSLETLERLALETNSSTWEASAAAIKNRLIPTRALMSLESFRQLILDAQAMMDPDFAGKLAADVAESSATDSDTGFGFGAESPADAPISVADESQLQLLDASHFSPTTNESRITNHESPSTNPESPTTNHEPFRTPGDSATLPELIRFIIDRSGYIKALETEGTPEAFSRIENLKELANAAHDAEERGETLAEFLDHAALASDTDQFDPNSRVTLMTLHAAKGLEFPLVFLAGLEEGLFPHSRTLSSPEELEEERRLCYVGMTRAMDTLILTRAHYRRRYGADVPEASVPSRFLEEVPPPLIENLGNSRPAWSTPAYGSGRRFGGANSPERAHFNYEDESQDNPHDTSAPSHSFSPKGQSAGAPPGDSESNIARFFGGRSRAAADRSSSAGWKSSAGRPGSFARPTMDIPASTGVTGLRKGQRVMHSKYGEGTVLLREGDGEDAKLTVLFAHHGMKKLMEKFANLRKL